MILSFSRNEGSTLLTGKTNDTAVSVTNDRLKDFVFRYLDL